MNEEKENREEKSGFLQIVYGSETGTATDVAEVLWNDCRRRKIHSKLCSIDHFDVTKLPSENVIVFVVSTTGQGEVPSSMLQFWKFLLRKSLLNDSLSRLKFAVFGLGDSSYQKYNFAAKKLFRRLVQLGGQQLLPLGLGDDQHDLGFDAGFEPWRRDLWFQLLENIGPELFDPEKVLSSDVLLPAKFTVEWLPDDGEQQNGDYSLKKYKKQNPDSSDTISVIKVKENRRLTSEDHFQDTRLIKFDTSECRSEDVAYFPGDVLMVQPRNLQESIDLVIEILGMDAHFLRRRFRLNATDANIALPPDWLLPSKTGMSVMHCFETYFDLQCVPRRSFFALLAQISQNEMEKEKLAELAAAENQQDLFDYCNRPKRTVVETLRDFPLSSKTIPFEYLFDLFTPIRPRPFSIASCPSSKIHPNSDEIHILVAKVEYRTKLAAARKGLCSNYLCQLSPGREIIAWIRKGTFLWNFNRNVNENREIRPLIFVGPGTGVAPFRSAVWHFCKNEDCEILLFFGCRFRGKDFYFEKEWANLPKNVTLVTAFSRDQLPKKVYVQHRMAEYGEKIWKLIRENNALVYVAGSAQQMPKDVVACLKEIARKFGKIDNSHQFVDQLEKSHRLQFETWL